MHAVSALISMMRLVFNISLRLGCFGSSFIFFMPKPKFLNVVITFERNPLLASCSNTEQQQPPIALLPKPYLYRPRIVTKVVKVARQYPTVYAIGTPMRLNPRTYNPVF